MKAVLMPDGTRRHMVLAICEVMQDKNLSAAKNLSKLQIASFGLDKKQRIPLFPFGK